MCLCVVFVLFWVFLLWSPHLLLCLHKITINVLLGEEFVRVVEPKAGACLELL